MCINKKEAVPRYLLEHSAHRFLLTSETLSLHCILCSLSYKYNIVFIGSHRVPLLLSGFLNDITGVILNCNILFFADDIKIVNIKNDDCIAVQEDLDILYY